MGGGKYVWTLIKLSEDIPWESPPPIIAYFGPSTKTKGIISFFLGEKWKIHNGYNNPDILMIYDMSTNLLTLSSLPPTHLLPSPNHTPTISLIPPTHPSPRHFLILFYFVGFMFAILDLLQSYLTARVAPHPCPQRGLNPWLEILESPGRSSHHWIMNIKILAVTK